MDYLRKCALAAKSAAKELGNQIREVQPIPQRGLGNPARNLQFGMSKVALALVRCRYTLHSLLRAAYKLETG